MNHYSWKRSRFARRTNMITFTATQTPMKVLNEVLLNRAKAKRPMMSSASVERERIDRKEPIDILSNT